MGVCAQIAVFVFGYILCVQQTHSTGSSFSVPLNQGAGHYIQDFMIAPRVPKYEGMRSLICCRYPRFGRRVQRSLHLSPVPTLWKKKGTEKLVPVTCAHALEEEGYRLRLHSRASATGCKRRYTANWLPKRCGTGSRPVRQ